MKKLLIVAIVFSFAVDLFSQNFSQRYLDYIEKYKELAIKEQYKHGIPASITMAQALLESNAGQSMLAVKGKNHFGIKCGGEWNGKTIRKDDDNISDCFRSYKRIEESYEDHSLFLKRDRYKSLFSIPMADYRGWAKALNKLGYATDANYANKLIGIIENYDLASLVDETVDMNELRREESLKSDNNKVIYSNYSELMMQTTNNGKSCYKLKKSATMAEIAQALGKKNVKTLLYYNDMFEDFLLPEGSFVYVSKKRSKADDRYRSHYVQAGESMHTIAQYYGITLKALYKINGLTYGTAAKEGMTLFLR